MPLLNKALLSMVDMTSMALADTLYDELYRCIVGKKGSHAESGGENGGGITLDFAWLTFIGLQIGYTDKEVS